MAMHWHRCRRWWRHGLECPFNSLVQHEEDDDDREDEDPDLDPVPDPVREPRRIPDRERKDEIEKPVGVIPPGRETGGGPRDRSEEVEDAIAEAEKIIREVPKPIPEVLEPVGDVTDFLPPPPGLRRQPALARTAAEDARVKSEQDEVKGKRPMLAGALARAPVPKSVGLAAALTMNQLSRLHPTLPPPHRKPQLALDEEVIVQEFMKAPKPSGFGFKAKQIGFIVGGAAAGIGAAFALGGRGGGGGGGSFAFNAAARLRGQLTTGAFP